MQRRRLKSVVFVEFLGAVVKCMHQQSSDTNDLRNHHFPDGTVLQHGCAKLNALGVVVNLEPSQKELRNGHVLMHRSSCHLVRDNARSHGKVAVNTVVLIRHHKRAAGFAQLVYHCAELEPLVENAFVALKSFQNVGGCKWLRCVKLQTYGLTAAQLAAAVMSRSSPGFGLGGVTSIAVNCWNLSAFRLKKSGQVLPPALMSRQPRT